MAKQRQKLFMITSILKENFTFNKSEIHLKKLYLILILILINSQLHSESLLKYDNNRSKFPYFFVRDTLYTHSNYVIEVNLNEQKIYLHTREGKILEFLCSTGNPRLEKGVETPEGIFVIQNKARKVYSTQFDSTLMLNWMGFNLNIGFHALLGKSYYRYLGKRVSSHGCIRISHEASEFFFKNIPIGTPVFIHSGKSARVIAFAPLDGKEYKLVNSKELNKLLKENLKFLYSGLYLNKHHKLLISHRNISHRGIEIGDENRIPMQLPSYQKSWGFYISRKLFDYRNK